MMKNILHSKPRSARDKDNKKALLHWRRFSDKNFLLKRYVSVPTKKHSKHFWFFLFYSVLGVICLASSLQADVLTVKPRLFVSNQDAKCLSFAPDGKTLAVGGERVQVFDVATGQRRLDQSCRRGTVLSLAFSPDGNLLALGIENDTTLAGCIELRDGHTGRLRRIFKTFRPQDTPAYSVAFSPDGKILAGNGNSEDALEHPSEHSLDGYLRLWQVSTGRLLMAAWVDEFSPPQFLPDGKMLIAPTSSGDIHLLSARTGQVIGKLPTHLAVLQSEVSQDGFLLALRGEPYNKRSHTTDANDIEIWDVRSRVRRCVLKGAGFRLDSMRFCSDGRLFTEGDGVLAGMGHFEGTDQKRKRLDAYPTVARLWNVKTGSASLPLVLGNDTFDLYGFSPSGHLLAIWTGAVIHLWPVR